MEDKAEVRWEERCETAWVRLGKESLVQVKVRLYSPSGVPKEIE
jgi:hypothetical protein